MQGLQLGGEGLVHYFLAHGSELQEIWGKDNTVGSLRVSPARSSQWDQSCQLTYFICPTGA